MDSFGAEKVFYCQVPTAKKDAVTCDAISSAEADSMDATLSSSIPTRSDECRESLFRNQIRQDIFTDLQSDLNANFARLQQDLDKTLASFLMQQKGKDQELEAKLEQKCSDLEAVVASGLSDIRGTKKSLEELADGLEEGVLEDMTALKVGLESLRKQVGEESMVEVKADIMRAISQDRKEMHCDGQFHDLSEALLQDMANKFEILQAKRTNFEAQLSRRVSELEALLLSYMVSDRCSKTCDSKQNPQLTGTEAAALRKELHSGRRNVYESKTVAASSDTSSTQFPSDASDDMPSSVEERLQKLEENAMLAERSQGRLEDIFDMTKDMMQNTLKLGTRVQAEIATMSATAHGQSASATDQKSARSVSVDRDRAVTAGKRTPRTPSLPRQGQPQLGGSFSVPGPRRSLVPQCLSDQANGSVDTSNRKSFIERGAQSIPSSEVRVLHQDAMYQRSSSCGSLLAPGNSEAMKQMGYSFGNHTTLQSRVVNSDAMKQGNNSIPNLRVTSLSQERSPQYAHGQPAQNAVRRLMTPS